MGYNSTFTGGFNIDPPLNHLEIDKAEEILCGNLELRLNKSKVDTPEGILVKRDCSYADGPEESGKYYDFQEKITEFVDHFSKDHKFSGEIVQYGEDNEDITGYGIKDNKVRTKRAVITFVWED